MIELLTTIDSVVWGPAMIALLLGTHIYLTFRTGFIQRKLPQAIRMSVRRDPSGKGDISSFGALATALAATIGTGSIVGVATALLAGGPGAIFWMWIAGLFGIATKYVETYAAVKYRVRDKSGAMLGGAMFVWKRAFARPDGSVPWWATAGCRVLRRLSPSSPPSGPARRCRRRPSPASSPRRCPPFRPWPWAL